MTLPANASPDDLAYVTALVRAHDRPRYYAALFAPRPLRDALFSIYGFAAEIARVPDQVQEARLGEIRLKWWSDALTEAILNDGSAETPALRAVSTTIIRHTLPIAPFPALIEARSPDLYSDPPAEVGDVEGRLGETESALFQIAAIILGAAGPESAAAAGHAGIAYGLARRLAGFASERARGRTIVPAEFLARRSLAPQAAYADRHPDALAEAIADAVALARRHLDAARASSGSLPAHLTPAFLPLAVVPQLLRRIERSGATVARQTVALSDLEMLLRIGVARFRGI